MCPPIMKRSLHNVELDLLALARNRLHRDHRLRRLVAVAPLMGTTLTLIAAALGAWGMIHAHRKGREDLLIFYAGLTSALVTLAVLP